MNHTYNSNKISVGFRSIIASFFSVPGGKTASIMAKIEQSKPLSRTTYIIFILTAVLNYLVLLSLIVVAYNAARLSMLT